LILGEVAHRNVMAYLSESGPSCADVDRQIIHARDNEKLLPCSAMSVSLATGLSRETVRRKLNKLLHQGYLAKRGCSYFTTSKPLEVFSEALHKEQVVDLLRTSKEVSKLL
jgi:DNA-binding IclR family transcriptional regulator